MIPRSFLAVAVLFVSALAPLRAPLAAQSAADVIRGKVIDDSAHVVVGAMVSVTRGPDRAFLQTTTDSLGRFSVTFDNGTGDYLVAVASPGYKAVRRRVQRQREERVLTADFTLVHDLATLAAVKVTAAKPERASKDISPFSPEPGASEKWNDGVEGQLPPSLAGNMNAMANTMSNLTQGPSGISLLGAGASSNLTTMNGMAMAAGSVPRAARTQTRFTASTFDPTRGGFSGANIDVRLGPGDRRFQQRNAFLTFDAPGLQYTDAAGRALGLRQSSFRGSAGADGELIRRTMTYNVALDYARSTSDPATLLTGDPSIFSRAGVASDSVQRLLVGAAARGLPVSGLAIPTQRERENVTWLGRIDDTRDTLDSRTLTTYATRSREGALGFTPLTSPSGGAERRENTFGVQLSAGNFFGEGRRTLNLTNFSTSQVTTAGLPYLGVPAASVLLRSVDSTGQVNVAAASLGGNAALATNEKRTTFEGSNELIWNADGRRHRFKLFAWGRVDALERSGGADLLGRYTYNSIADLAAGTPSSYTRDLSAPTRRGSVWNAATAFAHQWNASKWFTLLYGARLEADGFVGAPDRNAALEQALGITTGLAPGRVHVSPRVGFSYTYNRDRDNGNGLSMNNIGSFYRNTSGVLRGGIGEFRDLLQPGVLADARGETGLSGSPLSLSCVGAAVPLPDWSQFQASTASIPSQCLTGNGLLNDLAPSVTLIDRRYDVPRSWRASLGWSGDVAAMLVKVSALGSYDLNQRGLVDANFAGTTRFAIAGEGNRPVYVSPSSIDAATGTVSSVASRITPAYGTVGVVSSDLRGYGGQLSLSVSPDVFRARLPGSGYVSLGYTLQGSRREYRGFDGAAFGDPRVKEWAPSVNDARHIFVVQGGFYTEWTGALTLFARAQSGLPFTPVVRGDVNGDGRGGDRAYVPNAATETDTTLARQLRALLATGSASARSCVEAYAGRVADRNGCRGPWSATLNAQWQPPLPSFMSRLKASVYLQNVLGGLDQWLHGENGLRGWGAAAMPDPVLLVPRSFDAATNRFRYDVNARFADTRTARTLTREPFRITIDFSLRLSTDYPLQELRLALEPVKTKEGWQRRTADSITAFYLQGTSNVHKLVLSESDSLFLTKAQTAAFKQADSAFSEQVRATYSALGAYLASMNGKASRAALDSAKGAAKAYWKVFWLQPEIADSLLTASQKELLPMLKSMVQVPKRDREDSQWMFGNPVDFKQGESKPESERKGLPMPIIP